MVFVQKFHNLPTKVLDGAASFAIVVMAITDHASVSDPARDHPSQGLHLHSITWSSVVPFIVSVFLDHNFEIYDFSGSTVNYIDEMTTLRCEGVTMNRQVPVWILVALPRAILGKFLGALFSRHQESRPEPYITGCSLV